MSRHCKSRNTCTLANLFALLVLLVSVLQSPAANMQCKKTVIDVIMKQCSARIRRYSDTQVDRENRVETADADAELENPREEDNPRNVTVKVTVGGIRNRVIRSRQEYFPPLPSSVYDGTKSSLSSLASAGDDLGLDLTPTELDELYNQVSQRMPRASLIDEEDFKKLIIATIAKCCKDVQLCLQDQSIVLACP